MSKRLRANDDVIVPILHDEIRGEIFNHIEYDDTATLLSLLAVSQNVIRLVLPRIRHLLASFLKTEEPKAIITSIVAHQFKESTLTHKYLIIALHRYLSMNPTFWITSQLREWSATLVSMIRLAQLRNHYNKKASFGKEADQNEIPFDDVIARLFNLIIPGERQIERALFIKPGPKTPLKNIFYRTKGPPYRLVPLTELDHTYVALNMDTETDLVVHETVIKMRESHSLYQQEIYETALEAVKSKAKRAICYYILGESIPVKKAEADDLFQDVLIERQDVEMQFRHVYTVNNPITDYFRTQCVVYEGNGDQLSKALFIERNWRAACIQCEKRCKVIVEERILTLPVYERDWGNIYRKEPVLDDIYVLRPETEEDAVYRKDFIESHSDIKKEKR